MLQSNGLVGRISAKESIIAKLNNKEVRVYPELEDLIVTPKGEQQTFKSSKYGYDNVTVEAVQSEELIIIPNTEEQIKEGMFNKVTVAGDSDLIPENIKEGTEIFGVTGTMVGAWDTKQIMQCYAMFRDNETMEEAPYFDTSNVNNMRIMFGDCTNLKIVPEYNAEKVANVYQIFHFTNFPKFKYFTILGGFKNLGKAYTTTTANYTYYTLDLSNASNLTHDSLMSVINNLYDLNLTYDVANGGTLYAQSLYLGTTNKAKLTEEEIAIATSKGWNVS